MGLGHKALFLSLGILFLGSFRGKLNTGLLTLPKGY
jgi:hypothetical protein